MMIVASVLLTIGVGLSLLNWACLFETWRTQRYISPVFPVPSVLTALGLRLLEPTRAYWWAGLFTDYTLFSLIYATPCILADEWRTSRFTRIHHMRAEDGPRQFELSLHRGGRFLLRVRFDPPTSCNAYSARIASSGLLGRWESTPNGQFRLTGYRDERALTLNPVANGYVGAEEGYPADAEYPYDSLGDLKFRRVG